jgi:glycine cleavage system regulatory protein
MLFTPYALTDKVTRKVSDGGMITFSGLSTGGRKFSIVTRLDDAQRWVNGELIQDAFPYLDADQREILKTGIDTQSWDEMFAGSEDD